MDSHCLLCGVGVTRRWRNNFELCLSDANCGIFVLMVSMAVTVRFMASSYKQYNGATVQGGGWITSPIGSPFSHSANSEGNQEASSNTSAHPMGAATSIEHVLNAVLPVLVSYCIRVYQRRKASNSAVIYWCLMMTQTPNWYLQFIIVLVYDFR